MVGRKTSRGCQACRRRKVKCDLAQPSCSSCVKSGLSCPGYESRVIQVSFATDGKALTSSHGFHQSTFASGEPYTGTFVQMPANAEDRLRMAFVSGLDQASLRARLAVMPAYVVLQYVPQLLGRSKSLDQAAGCICVDGSPASTRTGYGRALRSIQAALWDETTAASSETLATAVILQMYENFTGHDSEGWVHAKGVATLLRLRGPLRIKTDIDRAILQSEVGTVFVDSLYKREACFLAGPEWAAVLQTTNLDKAMDAPGISALVAVILQFPALLNRYESFLRHHAAADAKPELKTADMVPDTAAFRDQISAYIMPGNGDLWTKEEGLIALSVNHMLRPLICHLASAVASFLLADMLRSIESNTAPLEDSKPDIESTRLRHSDAEAKCFTSAMMAAYLLDKHDRPPRREITNMMSIIGRVWNVAKDIHHTYGQQPSPLVIVLDNIWNAQSLDKLPLHKCYDYQRSFADCPGNSGSTLSHASPG